MLVFPFFLAAVGGYLLGSIPFGLVIVRAAGLGDIRQIGSGNIGATNVLRTGRKDLALATFLLDAGKAAIALMIASAIAASMPDYERYEIEFGLVAGGAAFLGHCYPVWLGFKGGKGVAAYFGLLLVGMPPLGVAIGVTWIAVALMFRMSSLAALVAVALAPVFALVGSYASAQIIFLLLLAVLIYWRHRENIARILAGTETRIGDKKADIAAPSIATPHAEPPASAES